jgi:ABC-2 type transport system ATP-binding protein
MSETNEKAVIEVKNLKKYFTVPVRGEGFGGALKSLVKREYKTVKAVDDISFAIEKGEMVGFLGPNGAGKTTTMKMLTGILYPTAGEVSVLGYNPTDRKETFQKQISMVMGQKNQLWWDLPATDAFTLNKEIYQIPTKEYKETLAELVELLDVAEILGTPVRKLSLGQRMKCELIAALLHRPTVLFLDEPTIGLDVVTQKKMREFFKKINREMQTTILLTSHYMEDVDAVCTRIIMINRGEKLYDGTIDNLIKTYAMEKYLQVDFETEVPRVELEKIGRVVEYEGTRVVIAVPRATHTKASAKLLTTYEVDNLDIQEVKLEDIIVKHFSK